METQKSQVSMGGPREIARLVETAGQSGEADMYAGKRHSKRFAEGMLLEVTADPARSTAAWTVYMHNVSDGGFAFWSKREVPARTTIYVRECADVPNEWLKARVTHCTRGIRGFLVGAAFDPPARAQ